MILLLLVNTLRLNWPVTQVISSNMCCSSFKIGYVNSFHEKRGSAYCVMGLIVTSFFLFKVTYLNIKKNLDNNVQYSFEVFGCNLNLIH